jgi:hypothetical protein
MTTETPAQDARWRNRIVGQADVPPAELRANPANWRAHPRRQREALRGSLDELGWVQQVLVNRTTGNIVDGHARLEEALRANAPTVPVLYVELTPEEEALALATIDPIAGMAVTDQAKLAELVAGITIDDDALRSLLAGLTGTTKDGLTDPDEIPDPSPSTRLQTGEMWALGNHRLFIGSSLEETSYKRLLGSRKAGLVHTDPPYGVAYMSSSGKHEAIENDELTGDKLVDFLAVAFTRMARHTEPSAAWYILARDRQPGRIRLGHEARRRRRAAVPDVGQAQPDARPRRLPAKLRALLLRRAGRLRADVHGGPGPANGLARGDQDERRQGRDDRQRDPDHRRRRPPALDPGGRAEGQGSSGRFASRRATSSSSRIPEPSQTPGSSGATTGPSTRRRSPSSSQRERSATRAGRATSSSTRSRAQDRR